MKQVVALERDKTFRKRDAELYGLAERQRFLSNNDTGECLRAIGFYCWRFTVKFIVREIHHDIEAPRLLRKLAHANEPLLRWNRTVEPCASQFARVAFFSNLVAAANLYCCPVAIGPLGEIYDAIGATPDLAIKPPVSTVDERFSFPCHVHVGNYTKFPRTSAKAPPTRKDSK